MQELTGTDRAVVADRLDDVPEHCIARHALLSGRCRAYVVGAPAQFDVLVIDPSVTRGELLAFGNPEAIAAALAELRGWSCVEVAPAIAEEMASNLSRKLK